MRHKIWASLHVTYKSEAFNKLSFKIGPAAWTALIVTRTNLGVFTHLNPVVRNKGPRSYFTLGKCSPRDTQLHSIHMSHVIPLLSASCIKITISTDVSFYRPASHTAIIYTLSLLSAHTSNFPTVIQPCTLHTSVTCKWWRRGHAETSIKGS